MHTKEDKNEWSMVKKPNINNWQGTFWATGTCAPVQLMGQKNVVHTWLLVGWVGVVA